MHCHDLVWSLGCIQTHNVRYLYSDSKKHLDRPQLQRCRVTNFNSLLFKKEEQKAEQNTIENVLKQLGHLQKLYHMADETDVWLGLGTKTARLG